MTSGGEGPEAARNGQSGSRRPFVIAVLFLLATPAFASTALQSAFPSAASNPHQTVIEIRSPPLAPIYQSSWYDEQVGITFGQNLGRVGVNVTAIAQTDSVSGVGPAYLLNGLTNVGYWYQVGLSYMWPVGNGVTPGFNMAYEVFMACATLNCNGCQGSIFPANCGIGLDNITVNPGDRVQLSLAFSGNNVVMQAFDWNTNSTISESFAAYGANQFLGLPTVPGTNGFFTGLMTEQYHTYQYYGTGLPVVFRQTHSNVSSGIMWMDEFDANSFQPVFSDETPPMGLANTETLQYFSSYGTAEAASSSVLVTGLTPVTLPSLSSSAVSSSYSAGQQASLTMSINDPVGLSLKITSLTISGGLGAFDVTSSAPSNLTGDSTFSTSIRIPPLTPNGNYTVAIAADFQFFDAQISGWVAPTPIYSSAVIQVGGVATPPPSNPSLMTRLTTLLRDSLPFIILSYIAAVIVTVVLVVTRRKPEAAGPVLIVMTCRTCGGMVNQTMLFCPSCGSALTQPANQTAADSQNQTTGQLPG